MSPNGRSKVLDCGMPGNGVGIDALYSRYASRAIPLEIASIDGLKMKSMMGMLGCDEDGSKELTKEKLTL